MTCFEVFWAKNIPIFCSFEFSRFFFLQNPRSGFFSSKASDNTALIPYSLIKINQKNKQCYQIVGFIPKPGIFEGLLGFFFAVWDNPKLGFFFHSDFLKKCFLKCMKMTKNLKKGPFFLALRATFFHHIYLSSLLFLSRKLQAVFFI